MSKKPNSIQPEVILNRAAEHINDNEVEEVFVLIKDKNGNLWLNFSHDNNYELLGQIDVSKEQIRVMTNKPGLF